MGFDIDEVMDLISVGGGLVREKEDETSENAASAKVAVTAVAVVEDKSEVYGIETSGTSFFLRGGAEAICSYGGRCRVGGLASIAGVPGVLGSFAAFNFGADYGIGDGDTKAFLGGEVGFLDPFSPAAEILSLEGRITMDVDDQSLGFMLFLNVNGSVKAAVSHN